MKTLFVIFTMLVLTACGSDPERSEYVVAESFISFADFKRLHCVAVSDTVCREAHLLAFQDALTEYYNLNDASTFKVCQLDPAFCADFRQLERFVLVGNKL